MRVFVITNDTYLWCLSPFCYLFNKYWADQEAVVLGFRPPTFEIPKNFRFHSLGTTNFPQSKWSNALIRFLSEMPDEFCVLMLEDYFITRPVDRHGIEVLYNFMQDNPNILRIDLTNDVLHSNGDARDAHEAGWVGHYDLVQKIPGMSYRMSFQAGIWNNKLLLSLLTPDKNPWEVEIQTSPPDEMKVYGTRQWPLRYCNAVYKGELDMREIGRLTKEDQVSVSTAFPKDINRRKYDQ
jgi:hypothetical protein